MSSQHPFARLNQIPLEAIGTTQFILPYLNSHFEVHNIFKKEQIKPHIAYQIRGDETIISMVRNNLGISLLHKLQLNSCTDGLVMKDLDNHFFRQIGILYSAKHLQTLSVHKMMLFIKEWNKKNTLVLP